MSKNAQESDEKIGRALSRALYLLSYVRYMVAGAILGAVLGFFFATWVKGLFIGIAVGILIRFIRHKLYWAIMRLFTRLSKGAEDKPIEKEMADEQGNND